MSSEEFIKLLTTETVIFYLSLLLSKFNEEMWSIKCGFCALRLLCENFCTKRDLESIEVFNDMKSVLDDSTLHLSLKNEVLKKYYHTRNKHYFEFDFLKI